MLSVRQFPRCTWRQHQPFAPKPTPARDVSRRAPTNKRILSIFPASHRDAPRFHPRATAHAPHRAAVVPAEGLGVAGQDSASSGACPAALVIILLVPISFVLGWLQGGRAKSVTPTGARSYSVAANAVPAAHRFASMTLSSSRGGRSASFAPDVVVKYNVLKLFSMPTVGRLLVVVAMAIPISLVGGVLYRFATGGEQSLGDCINKTYNTWANLPGITITEETSAPAAFVMHTVFGVGLLTFAAVLGIITEDMSGAFEEVRSGNHSVAEVGHTVVLGYNRHLMPVLRQMATAMKERRGSGRSLNNPVVVLADRDKLELDAEILEELKGLGLDVVTRRGKASRVEDLRRVAAAAAGTVIMLHPEEMDEVAASSHKAASLAALNAVGGISGQNLVVQMWDGSGDLDAAQVAYERFAGQNQGGMVQVLGKEKISKVMAQCAVQPGLGRVLSDILQQTQGGSEFYFSPCPAQLAGKQYGEVRRYYQHAIPVGVMVGATQQLRLNPPEALEVGEGDSLAFVAVDARHVTDVRSEPYQAAEAPGKASKWKERAVNRVVVLSFGDGGLSDTSKVVSGLDEFARKHTDVTVIQEGELEEHCGRCRVKVVRGNPASLKVLQEAGVADADSVIITGLQHLGPDEADAQVVASVLQLQRLQLDEGEGSQHVVAAIINADTQDVLAQVTSLTDTALAGFTVDAISPDDLISGIMTQVAAEPSLNIIYQELFGGTQGCELYLRDPRRYDLPIQEGEEVTWAQVFEAARRKGETVIGCITGSGELLMALDALQQAPVSASCRLVAIAEGF